VVLPKKGDLSLCKNYRVVCLLDACSKIVSKIVVKRLQSLLDKIGREEQNGFTPSRGTVDGIFLTYMALLKRKEHNQSTWVLFIDLVKAFDSVPREALFLILRRYGLPDHFVNIIIRLHSDAKLIMKFGDDVESEIKSLIGVRQGSCEGPILFLFVMQAVLETIQWPEEIEKPSFMTALNNGKLKENVKRRQGAVEFEFWASLYADDFALFFKTREQLQLGARYILNHFKKFGLRMHTGKNGVTSKTVAMFCPSQSVDYNNEDTSNIVLDGDGNIIPFVRSTVYLGTEISDSLTSTCDVERRMKKASNIFGALKAVLTRKDIGFKNKGIIYISLCISVLLYGSECWCMTDTIMGQLRSFHARSARIMCGINMYHVQQHHITTASLLEKLGLKSIVIIFNLDFFAGVAI
jgi:hypothetical protein